MKIVYCIHSTYNPGGMERTLLNKVRWLWAKGGYEITVVTTDQKGRPPFFEFPHGVKTVDLDINYSDDNGRNPVLKTLGYLRRRSLHKKRLASLLEREKADITVSLFPSESSFIPSLEDGSKKVLELHFCKFFRLQYNRGGLLGLADRLRTRLDERLVRRFDKFVVLTLEDAGYWGPLPNIEIIPNAAPKTVATPYYTASRRVVAAGRLDYQKGFDRLISAWGQIPAESREGWRLDIFGQGEWQERLENQIRDMGLSGQIGILPPSKNIMEEFAKSSFLAMSSHYEGFPMVMVEAMACGLPVVSFDFKCGPKDIIANGENGFTVPQDDIGALASAMARLMENDEVRTAMSASAASSMERFSEDRVMNQWVNCFKSIL